MGIDLLSKHWTSAELLEWKETVDPILAGISLAFCIVAQVIFYIFPRLRVFPRSIISWVNLYNLTYMIYIIIKWSPHSVLHRPWVLELQPGSLICKIGIVIDNANLLGSVSCTLLLCFTMFLHVVFRINIEGKKVYFWSYLAFATVFPAIIPIIAIYAFPQSTAFGVCIIGNDAGDLMIKVILLIMFFAQVLFLIITVVYIKRVLYYVKATPDKFPLPYLMIWFTAIFFCQLFELLPNGVAILFIDPSIASNAIFTRVVAVTRLFGPVLDASVLILGNADFMDWAKKKLAMKFGATAIPTEMELRSNPQHASEGLSSHDELLAFKEKSATNTPEHPSPLGKSMEDISLDSQHV